VILDGLNETVAGTTGRTLRVPVAVTPFAVAETVAVFAEDVTAVVIVKEAVVAPEATVTVAGTVTPAVLLVIATARPPDGA